MSELAVPGQLVRPKPDRTPELYPTDDVWDETLSQTLAARSIVLLVSVNRSSLLAEADVWVYGVVVRGTFGFVRATAFELVTSPP